MKLLTDIADIDRGQWQALVNRSTVASVFQTPEMFDFYNSSSAFNQYIFAVEESGELRGLVVCTIQSEGGSLKKLLTSRAIINGGPLLDDDITTDELSLLLCTIVDSLRRSCIYIETRNLNDYSRWRDTFDKCGFRYTPHYNFHIDTTNPVEVDKRMDKSRRRRIRRATEHGVTVSSDNAFLPDFYNILSDLYHTKIHKPLPPYSLFERLTKEPFVRYFFVQDPEGKTIGGQLILMLDKRTAYAWYCCGLDKEYHDLYPSIMANYAAIHYAADNGFERYDMMGGGTPGEDYGVRDFKAQFGGTMVEHGRYLHVCHPFVYWLGCKAITLMGKLNKWNIHFSK